MSRDAIRCGVVTVLALGLVASASGDARLALPPPGGPGWEPVVFPRVERKTHYTAFEGDGSPAVRAESDCAASALAHPLEPDLLARTPRLRWRWRVERGLASHDERVKDGDDFAARVYVMFRFDPARASVWERMRHRLGRTLFGEDLAGSALNYVWSSREPSGARWDSPYTEASKMISLGSGALPDWRREEVDVAADYRTTFGAEPPALLGLALMTDTDNTCTQAAAAFADFEFLAP